MKKETILIFSELCIIFGIACMFGAIGNLFFSGYGFVITGVFLIGGGLTLIIDEKMFNKPIKR